jgi:hypothetical protein
MNGFAKQYPDFPIVQVPLAKLVKDKNKPIWQVPLAKFNCFNPPIINHNDDSNYKH